MQTSGMRIVVAKGRLDTSDLLMLAAQVVGCLCLGGGAFWAWQHFSKPVAVPVAVVAQEGSGPASVVAAPPPSASTADAPSKTAPAPVDQNADRRPRPSAMSSLRQEMALMNASRRLANGKMAKMCMTLSDSDDYVSQHFRFNRVMECYLSVNVARLCEPAQRAELADLFVVFDGIRSRVARMTKKPKPSARDPYPDWDGPLDRAAFSKLRGLAQDGYFSLEDFKDAPPPDVVAALRNVSVKASRCR